MAKIYSSVAQLVGDTPLLELSRFAGASGIENVRLLAKLEYFNPAGSVKDRVALAMVDDAEQRGVLPPGGTMIEPTSGNTGVGLAMVAAVRGYRLILTMPETMSIERRKLLAALGAEIVLTPGPAGMKGAIKKAEELAAEIPGVFMPRQFSNPANRKKHEETTGPEIWRDTDGRIDAFVAGVGTGGTISGVGAALKAKNSDIRVFAVEPSDSPVLSGGQPGPHGLQGIGAGFVPDNYKSEVVDGVLPARLEDAVTAARLLAKTEGILVGISSGAALWAAGELAKSKVFQGKTIVVLLPDTGERYLSTQLFE